MTTTRIVTYTAGLAGLWIALALWRPETTYHLAPLLVVGLPPVGAVLDPPERSLDPRFAAGSGIALGLGATALLASTNHLTGPSLLPFGGAVTEAVVFAAAGAAIGLLFAVIRRR